MRRALVLLAAAGCGGDDDLPALDSAALIQSQHTGSGVYVGGGRLLTNWHVCVAPLFDESLGEDDHLRYFDDPGGGAAPTVEGAGPDTFYCLIEDGADRDYQLSAVDRGGCVPMTSLAGQRLAFTRIGVEAGQGRLRFADWSIDACIVELDADARAVLDRALTPLTLDAAPVEVGRQVVVAGHNRSAINEVGVDRCEVVAATALVVDPDPIQPSPLEVPSFAIDCRELEHGSSGSPVFDAATGALLGLVWTGVDLGTDQARVYVSAISAWRGRVAARPSSQTSQLDALLPAP